MNTSKTLLLRNARVVTPDQTLADREVLIESAVITGIFTSHSNRSVKADSEIDLRGYTLFPGFIDVHIHGAAGIDTMNTNSADLARFSEFLARQGVTSWLPTLVPASDESYERAAHAIAESMKKDASYLKARVLGVHYEGPFVNSEQCGALHREHFRTFKTANDLDSLPTIKNPQAAHMMTLAPEIEGGIDLIKELTKRGWIVSIGHTRAPVEVLDEARTFGARHMTHFMNAMTPLHHRDLGAVGWGLANDDVTFDMIADGIHIDRSILKMTARAKSPEQISLISDSIAATGMGDGQYEIWGETISVKDGKTSNAHGSIAGSVITMLDAVRMMLSLGFRESEVARMASLNPARLLRINDECGSIKEGKRADLVALDADQNVVLTIIGGEIAYGQ